MNTDETVQKTTKANKNIKKNQSADKPKQETISNSKSIKIEQISSEEKITLAPTTTSKRLNTTNSKQQIRRRTSSTSKSSTLLSASLSSLAATSSSSTSSSSSPPSFSSSLSLSSTKFKSSSQIFIENRDIHKASVNVCFTNTSEANQLKLLTTAIIKMPTRTTTPTAAAATTTTKVTSTKNMTKNLVAELNAMKLSTTTTTVIATATPPTATNETSSSSSIINSSSSAATLELPLASSSFRRSLSVPILKIDDVSRQSVNSISSHVECDKKNTNLKSTTIKTTTTTTIPSFGARNYKHGAKQENRLTNHRLSESDATSPKAKETATTITPTKIKPTNNEIKLSATDAGDMSHTTTTADRNKHDDDDDDADAGALDVRRQRIREDLRFGCAHYKRRAMFVTPCCNKFYKCRFCHDENESHHFDRKTLNELICSECNTRQKVQEACMKCGVRFGKYICLICNLFDDEDKKQYHCDACGICRIGGAENFFHCEVCNMCLPIQLKIDGHKCVENISRSHCPVCLGDIHTSRIPCHIPDCGHLLHKMCFDQLLASGHYACPTCQTSLIDMTALWDFLDAQASQMPMPKKYENQRIHIFCNDCHRASKTNFHFIGLKCMECGAYNTTQDVKRRVSLVPGDEPNTA